MIELTRNSYAKVNIGLKVLEKRPDGYHDLDTYFHLIDLHDVIHFLFDKSSELSIDISGNESYLEKGRMDLMEKSARLFSLLSGIKFRLNIRIEKNIPSQAGLGGGSGNAASVLEVLNELCLSPFSRKELADISLALGSDVPFFVSGFPSARGTGRGEVLTEERPLGYEIDIISPSVGAGTPGMFGKLDAVLPKNDRHLPPHLMENLGKEDFPNDFELVSKEYKLLEKLASKYSFFSLTGSGSCSYGVKKGQEKENFDENIVHGYEKVDIIPSFLLTTK